MSLFPDVVAKTPELLGAMDTLADELAEVRVIEVSPVKSVTAFTKSDSLVNGIKILNNNTANENMLANKIYLVRAEILTVLTSVVSLAQTLL